MKYIFLTIFIISICTITYFLPKYLIKISINKYYPEIKTNIAMTHEKNIAITIDDVPYGSEKEILELLDDNDIKVSLFVIANKNAKKKENILVNAVKNGHQLCNHGTTDTMHALKSKEKLMEEIEICQKFIDGIYKKANVEIPKDKYYRPGCGYFTKEMISTIQEMGLKLVLGNVYSHDPQMPIGFINYLYIIKKLEGGDIIIVHDRPWTINLLEKLIPWIKKNNFNCVTLSN